MYSDKHFVLIQAMQYGSVTLVGGFREKCDILWCDVPYRECGSDAERDKETARARNNGFGAVRPSQSSMVKLVACLLRDLSLASSIPDRTREHLFLRAPTLKKSNDI